MENNDIYKELQGLNSPLAKMEKKNPFEVPVNYFEEMPESVQSHISHRKKMLPAFGFERQNLLFRRAPVFALLLVFFAIVLYMVPPKNTSVSPNVEVAESPVNQQKATEEELLDVIDEDLLVEAYTETAVAKPANAKLENTAKSTAIEEYILDNIDEPFLIEEL